MKIFKRIIGKQGETELQTKENRTKPESKAADEVVGEWVRT